jgi:hypothetical protein
MRTLEPLGYDWQYFKLNPLMTHNLEPRGERLFELIVIVRAGYVCDEGIQKLTDKHSLPRTPISMYPTAKSTDRTPIAPMT